MKENLNIPQQETNLTPLFLNGRTQKISILEEKAKENKIRVKDNGDRISNNSAKSHLKDLQEHRNLKKQKSQKK